MSITELAAIGEIVGAMGVVASLIYLSVQIRQNTHAMDEGRRLAIMALQQPLGARLRNALSTGRPAAIQFWYRAGAEPLRPQSALGSVTPLDPRRLRTSPPALRVPSVRRAAADRRAPARHGRARRASQGGPVPPGGRQGAHRRGGVGGSDRSCGCGRGTARGGGGGVRGASPPAGPGASARPTPARRSSARRRRTPTPSRPRA